jgi:DNA transformation protein
MSKGSKTTQLVHHFVEQLSPLGDVTHRTMFGAECLFIHGKAFGIVEDGELYLKVDPESRPRFLAAGGRAFRYLHKASGRSIEMSYVTIPEDDLDDPSALLAWGRMAAEVSGRAGKPSGKGKTRKSATGKGKGQGGPTAADRPRARRRSPARRPRG